LGFSTFSRRKRSPVSVREFKSSRLSKPASSL